MCAYWCYKFSLNEDSTVVTYRKFYERHDDTFPTVSMCLENPFLEKRLAEYGVNESSYLAFLEGNEFSNAMMKVDFDHVTIDVSDYIKGYRMYFRNGSIIKFDKGLSFKDKRSLNHVSFAGFTGYYNYFMKCFALNVPQIDNLEIFRILLPSKIFPKGIRPTKHGFRTYVHLPKQFLLSSHTAKWVWPYRGSNESYKMRFLVDDVIIERKRSKKDGTCNQSWNYYDDWISMIHTNETGCNIPYQTQHEKLQKCNTQELMRHALYKTNIVEAKMYEKPCKTMETVRIEHLESKINTKEKQSEGEFWFSLSLVKNRFKDINQIRYL